MRLFPTAWKPFLGKGVVGPYLVVNGEIVAANPWEGDDEYNAASTSWYQMAMGSGRRMLYLPAYIQMSFPRSK